MKKVIKAFMLMQKNDMTGGHWVPCPTFNPSIIRSRGFNGTMLEKERNIAPEYRKIVPVEISIVERKKNKKNLKGQKI